ncbi:MAG: hypothetical protein A2087_07255 [Spirochaetes bacterium GWD1_61_31]|nr:MAG: hypothetical protein A2Y37_08220 [Spirochaetes bacterium GWB1_60_80]OHD34210.1 MAG: hypothetical protein A2004_12525 [Spirochaetes bacterium GWC1_61_12]OHD40138.1 MAG: hypothetical protein A2087_07255 [Spirochaetes bacterium GWD1_61_31]OHD45814.1 MAG: hypothetical protein A2Y35_03855 [Spirochaetes bacterium GWE1_60_18]OHD58357.1 MAG: hypothetical protein A2Y32_06245 [Spirochaetes bacterium GWF1_60_12]HAW86356.1 hypothetical protein [Spirochaetaceae bacterium]
MTRFIKTLLAVAIVASLSACLLPAFGNGSLSDQTIQVGAFDSLDISGVTDLEFVVSDTRQVVISIDSNLQDLIIVSLDGSVLEIGMKPFTSMVPAVASKITVYGPAITDIQSSGTGQVTIPALNLADRDFSLSSSGTGTVSISMLQVPNNKVTISLSGTGDCTLQGQARNLVILTEGTGTIHANDLPAETVQLAMSGTGHCHVSASLAIVGTMSGIGNLYYYGKSATPSVEISGLGSIIAR